MKGAPTSRTRSLADGAWNFSTLTGPGVYRKVHAGKGFYFATDFATDETLKTKANVRGRCSTKDFHSAGPIEGMPGLGHVTMQRSYPDEATAFIAMDMLESVYKLKVADDYDQLGMPILEPFDHQAPRIVYNQAHLCWRLLMAKFDVKCKLWNYCPFQVFDETMDSSNPNAVQRALVPLRNISSSCRHTR